MSGSIPSRDLKILVFKSGGACAFEDCKKRLVEDGDNKNPSSVIGDIAHIKGEKEGSARFDSSLEEKYRNKEPNLILLCKVHHKIVDDQPEKYSVEKLLEIKKNHENWVIELIRRNIVEIGFAELEIVTKYLVSCSEADGTSLDAIAPKEKLEKNNLSQESERLLKIGGSQVNEVKKYINSCIDPNFEKRLIKGFSDEYSKLKKEGANGDELFNTLISFASTGSSDPKLISAGLTILSYLFEKCEVFEK